MKINIYILNINNINEGDLLIAYNKYPNKYLEIQKSISELNKKQRFGSLILLSKYLPNLEENHISYNKYNKPYSEDIYFNISHEDNFVVLAICKEEIGVDICNIYRQNNDISLKMYTKREQNYIAQNPNAFSKIWSMKESVGKCLGLGLCLNFTSFDVCDFMDNKSIKIMDKNIYNKTVDYKDYFISLSSYKIIDEIEIKEV